MLLFGPNGTEALSTDDAGAKIIMQQPSTAGQSTISVAATTTTLFDSGGPFPPAVTRRAYAEIGDHEPFGRASARRARDRRSAPPHDGSAKHDTASDRMPLARMFTEGRSILRAWAWQKTGGFISGSPARSPRFETAS
jgi:hypothetical protein